MWIYCFLLLEWHIWILPPNCDHYESTKSYGSCSFVWCKSIWSTGRYRSAVQSKREQEPSYLWTQPSVTNASLMPENDERAASHPPTHSLPAGKLWRDLFEALFVTFNMDAKCYKNKVWFDLKRLKPCSWCLLFLDDILFIFLGKRGVHVRPKADIKII